MKKHFLKGIAFALAVCALPVAGCGHKHDFSGEVVSKKYLCTEATCIAPATYYYSCECGEKGTETFQSGEKDLRHIYTEMVEDEKYLKTEASCLEGAVYYKACVYCGKKGYGNKTFQSSTLGAHNPTVENPDWAYVKEEATKTSAATFYKSCVCGAVGEETFTHGEPLREYTDEEKAARMPTTLTVTLYDTENSVYGFTYHTEAKPLRPVIQVSKGDSLSNDFEEYSCSVEVASSMNKAGGTFNYYLVKAEVPMEDLSTYTYRAYDKYADVGTDAVTVETKDLQSESFTFAHVSDSQSTSGGGYFSQVLEQLSGNVDFLLHTGDVVEYSLYEEDWTSMVHNNFTYLSKMPIMAIAGNHDAIYQAGDNELYEHFNYPVVNGQDTDSGKGQYYSFTYGNAKFIMLNTNASSGARVDEEQLRWLKNELASNTATWTIVGLHQPMYSPGRYGSSPDKNSQSLLLRAQLGDLFAQYGVDLVLQGHDHVLSRTYPIGENGSPVAETWKEVGGVQYSQDPSGVIYLMNGPASDQYRIPVDEADASLYSYKKQSNTRSFATITIEGNRLTVSAQYVSDSKAMPYADATWGIEKSA